MTPFERCDLCNQTFCGCRSKRFDEAVVLIPTTKSNPELAAKVAEETKQILKDMRNAAGCSGARRQAGGGMKWLYRILRLFFCPHRWADTGHKIQHFSTDLRTDKRYETYLRRVFECKYCGSTREQP